jgi:hypothetical protein
VPFRSAIVNEQFVRHYLPGRDPIGVRIGIAAQPDTPTDIEIVGVVSNFSYRGLREMDDQGSSRFSRAAFREGCSTSAPVPHRPRQRCKRPFVSSIRPFEQKCRRWTSRWIARSPTSGCSHSWPARLRRWPSSW